VVGSPLAPLAPEPQGPVFAMYQQFLHLGEAGLAVPMNAIVATRMLASEAEQDNWTAGWALEIFESRLGLVMRQLERTPYVAGESFTAADISVAYALLLARRAGGIIYGEVEEAYIERVTGRDSYKRAMNSCHDTREWAAQTGG
jgi:glutathione S-transferase